MSWEEEVCFPWGQHITGPVAGEIEMRSRTERTEELQSKEQGDTWKMSLSRRWGLYKCIDFGPFPFPFPFKGSSSRGQEEL